MFNFLNDENILGNSLHIVSLFKKKAFIQIILTYCNVFSEFPQYMSQYFLSELFVITLIKIQINHSQTDNKSREIHHCTHLSWETFIFSLSPSSNLKGNCFPNCDFYLNDLSRTGSELTFVAETFETSCFENEERKGQRWINLDLNFTDIHR